MGNIKQGDGHCTKFASFLLYIRGSRLNVWNVWILGVKKKIVLCIHKKSGVFLSNGQKELVAVK